MKWRDLLLTLACLLFVAPFVTGQTIPVSTGGISGGIARLLTGTVGAPSLSFVAFPNSGLYDGGSGTPTITVGGAAQVRFQTSQFSMVSSEVIGWSSGDPTVAAVDTGYKRLGAASVSLSNATTGPGALQMTGSNTVLAIPVGGIGFATAATTSVGNTGQGARLVVVCGPTAGTASLLFYAGTTNVPVVLANAVGGGLIGC